MQVILGSQGEPAGRLTSLQVPVAAAQVATLHGPVAAGQDEGASSRTPKAQPAPVAHLPPTSHEVPLGLCAATQPPVRASQMPVEQGPSRLEQSRGTPEQVPLLHVPVVKQPLTPQVSPVVGV